MTSVFTEKKISAARKAWNAVYGDKDALEQTIHTLSISYPVTEREQRKTNREWDKFFAEKK